MKNKKYHAVGTGPKSNSKVIEKGKIDSTYTQIYMTAYFPWFVQAFQ
jgi:hypothetical protein